MNLAPAARLLAIGLAVALVPAVGSGAVAKKAPTYVGSVTAVGGTKKVTIRATPASAAVTARAGARIPLGATVVMGKGASATLRLKRPASVPASRTLAYVRSARGAKHTSTVTRNAKGVVTVRIVPG